MERRKLRFKPAAKALKYFPSLKKVPYSLNQSGPNQLPMPMSTRHSKGVPKLSLQKLSGNSPPTSNRGLQGFMTSRTNKNLAGASNTSLISIAEPPRLHKHSASMPEISEVKYPITPSFAIRTLGDYLTAYEQSEILDYPQIYFLGKGAAKVPTDLKGNNYGFDDEKAEYRVVIGDHIQYRYEVLSMLGKGSFGQVLKCKDHMTGDVVALKIIRNKPKFNKQAAVEVKVLNYLKLNDPEDKKHVIRMISYFQFRSHVCVTFELLNMDLYEFLKFSKFQGLSLKLVKRVVIQLLDALKYTREHSVIHCDLKPENILLVNAKSSAVKVIDFGSSCFEDERIYTYIQSRFYRAPEIMMGIPYTPAIDMWSLGCIAAELYCGIPLFPGESENEQMLRIMEVIGTPPPHLIEKAGRSKLFFEPNAQPKILPNSRGKMRYPNTRPLPSMIGSTDALFLDFLNKILVWDPEKRITPEEALSHPWITAGMTRRTSSFVARID